MRGTVQFSNGKTVVTNSCSGVIYNVSFLTYEAARYLANNKPEQLFEYIQKYLDGEKVTPIEVSNAIDYICDYIDDDILIPALLELTKDQTPIIRESAARSLSWVNCSEEVKIHLKYIINNDPVEAVRIAADDALDMLNDVSYQDPASMLQSQYSLLKERFQF